MTSAPQSPVSSPTGEQYAISSGAYTAVVTELGAALRLLRVDGRDLLAGFGEQDRISGGRGQQLMPWPNRIGDGHYRFDGRDYQLPLSEPERRNAIHGLVRWVPWQLVEHTADTVTQQVTVFPQKGWDSTIRCTITHQLSDRGLTVTVGCQNVGDRSVPFGYAAHPYFTLGEDSVDQLEITVPATRYLEVDDRMLPVRVSPVDGLPQDLRSGAVVGDRLLDTAYTGLDRDAEHDAWRIRLGFGERETYVWGDRNHHWVQIFTGDTRRDGGLAVEPMTCGPDAFNSELTADGLVVLAPGDSYQGSWGVYGR